MFFQINLFLKNFVYANHVKAINKNNILIKNISLIFFALFEGIPVHAAGQIRFEFIMRRN